MLNHPVSYRVVPGVQCAEGNHDWGEWRQTLAVTCEQDGEERRTCARCGETQAQAVPSEGHETAEEAATRGGGYQSAGLVMLLPFGSHEEMDACKVSAHFLKDPYAITVRYKKESAEGIFVELIGPDSYVYDGKAKKPRVKVTSADSKTLKKDVDYEIAYEDNRNAGTASILVTGKGSYSGRSVVTFEIVKAGWDADADVDRLGPATFRISPDATRAKVSYKVVKGRATVSKKGKVALKSDTAKVRIMWAADANHKAASKMVTLKRKKAM